MMHEPQASPSTGGNVEDRDKLIGRLAIRFEQIETDRIELNENEKLIDRDCKDAGLTRVETAALKRLAKLRVADKLDSEREKLAALATVGNAMGIDLFAWAEGRDQE